MIDAYEDGRTATPERLAASLLTGPAAFIDGALANDALQPQHLLMLMRNPSLDGVLLQRIGRSPHWMKSYRLRAALVQHQRTPKAVAMNLLSSLRWHDLAQIIGSPRLSITVRTAAERILVLRIPELTLGEKISLARIATPPIVSALRWDGSALVIRALLENPLLRYEDALLITERADTPGAVLQALAESPRFARRQELRMLLSAHPSTPPAVALRIVAGLEEGALQALAVTPSAPVLVRLSAERRLTARPDENPQSLP